ncbi:hypothetical protein [Microbacterium album]|uniref:Di-and tripeptidase n=1 Tax=Microbacterium album TaxID=2053191 RepID=A0A917IEB2_9MICO|nr:hypothetical protein [Microbacterium album]GGH40166.1 hypothetical protein GCM10010921_11890 [Microbacterium album]
MSDKVHRIHSLPADAPWDGGLPPAGSREHPMLVRVLDRVIRVQRPAVVSHIRSIRLRHPDATPDEIVRILEKRYLTAVTTGGAAVGATAVVPGIGTAVTLGLSGAETVGFLEATTLFAQSLAEVHGIAVESPDRGRALVLALMLGDEGVNLVRQLARQAVGKSTRSAYWGELVTTSLPRAAVGPLVDRLKKAFIHHFATRGGASFVGKALPFGVGAAIGGAGNHILGRRVVVASRKAFGAAPAALPADLEPREGAEPLQRTALRGAKRAGSAIAWAAGSAAHGVGAAGRALGGAGRRAGRLAGRALPGGRSQTRPSEPEPAAPADAPAHDPASEAAFLARADTRDIPLPDAAASPARTD